LRNTGNDFVYLVLTYDSDPGPAEVRRMSIRRYSYDSTTGTMGSPVDLLSGLPAGDDHVSGRLVFGQDQKLYLTIGDGGFNQLSLFCQPIRAQELPTAAEVGASDWRHYEGKILRVNLDGSIPADNPVFVGVRSHIFTTGHRNAQGLIVAPDGRIYASEHGPSIDDELNLIQGGRNYGWPYIAGYKDDSGVRVHELVGVRSRPVLVAEVHGTVRAGRACRTRRRAPTQFRPSCRRFGHSSRCRTTTTSRSRTSSRSRRRHRLLLVAGDSWLGELGSCDGSHALHRVSRQAQRGRRRGRRPDARVLQDARRATATCSWDPMAERSTCATDSSSTENPGAVLAFTYQQ
jgi:hypothetical protein